MKSLVLIFVCMVLIGCSDDKRELEELQRKHEEAQAKLQAELWALQDSERRAFADAISKSSIDQRIEALNHFIKVFPSSPLVAKAKHEIQELENIKAKKRLRDQELSKTFKSQEASAERERRRREAHEEDVQQKRKALKIRCIDIVSKGKANLEELNIALMGMTESELVSLLGTPDRAEQKREFYYYRGIGIETATGKKRGIIVTFGGGTSLEPRVNMVRWRI